MTVEDFFSLESFADVQDAELPDDGPEACLDRPLLPVRDTVLFPHMFTPLFVGRERSLRAIDAAMSANQRLIVVSQKDEEVQNPEFEDLYTIGTEVVIGRMLRMPDGTTSIWTKGQRRVRVLKLLQSDPHIVARAVPLEESTEEGPSTEALRRAVLALFDKVVHLSSSVPEDAYVAAMNVDDPGWLADLIASVLDLKVHERQELLEASDSTVRLQRVSILLAKELDVLELENRIQSQIQQEVDKSQREYFLREQLRAIQDELGESDPQQQEVSELRAKVGASGMPEEVRAKAERELSRLSMLPSIAPEVGVIRTYLDWLVSLPWDKETEDNLDMGEAAQILEDNHYGLPKAKERVLEYMAVRKLAPDKMRSPILCFVGPPGTGKTSLGRSIALALGREFVRVSLGGIHDEAEIRGHRRTYVGALPGRVIQTMRKAGTANPLFMLDEIDKVGQDFRGDPSAALLEVLDPEQNYAFSDHYLDVAYDLSKVIFITTANMLDPIPPALQDRMEVIEFPGYIEEEKLEIARRFLVPRQVEQNGLADLAFSDTAILQIIREYTYEAGVRNLEREIANICRKVARMLAEEKKPPTHITTQSLGKYLGPPRYSFGRAEESDEIGVATGLACTAAGGDILAVEVTLMKGKGSLTLTGQLGDVMQESAQAALSYVRSRASDLDFEDVDFDKLDVHVHVPESAIPKDGPSAGITIATALVSALTDRPARRDVAMTGEITLRGRILAVGGIRDKVLAAYRSGLETMILPEKNQKDLVDIPSKVRRRLKFEFVSSMDQVVPIALAPASSASAEEDTPLPGE